MLWFPIVLLVVVALLIPTAYAGYIGAPFVPTRMPVVRKAFAALDVGEDDIVYDLGAGDGRIVRLAAELGASARGFELSPIMWAIAKLRTLSLSNASIRYGNFFHQDIEDATIIFVFLIPGTIPKFHKWLRQRSFPHGKVLMSYVFPLPKVQPMTVIREPKCGAVYVYDLEQLTGSK